MVIEIKIICDKCGREGLYDTFIPRSDWSKDWSNIDNLILCKSCIKDWSESFKKMKKENKEKFLKDK